MRYKNALIAAVMVCAGGLILIPSSQEASARQFKQLAIAIINYEGSVEPPDVDRLLSKSGDALPGMLLTEKDEIFEAVAVQRRDNDFVFIQLDTGETVPAVVVWSDVDDFLVMDADGGLALFIVW